eukprot:CFRG1223T1
MMAEEQPKASETAKHKFTQSVSQRILFPIQSRPLNNSTQQQIVYTANDFIFDQTVGAFNVLPDRWIWDGHQNLQQPNCLQQEVLPANIMSSVSPFVYSSHSDNSDPQLLGIPSSSGTSDTNTSGKLKNYVEKRQTRNTRPYSKQKTQDVYTGLKSIEKQSFASVSSESQLNNTSGPIPNQPILVINDAIPQYPNGHWTQPSYGELHSSGGIVPGGHLGKA